MLVHYLDFLRPYAMTFLTTFSGLVFETLPFLAIGSFLASVIHVWVPERYIAHVFAGKGLRPILAAAGLGFILPICECAIVPLARRLNRSGTSPAATAAFLLAAPIVNPLTIASTCLAFRGFPHSFALVRLGTGLSAALAIALVVAAVTKGRQAGRFFEEGRRFTPSGGRRLPAPFLPIPCRPRAPAAAGDKLLTTLQHTADEFLDVSRFLIAGLAAAALVRTLLPPAVLSRTAESAGASVGAGIAAAYLLSLCSSADAFVARSLFLPGSPAAALGFLVAGPMIDIKNTLLLARFLRPKSLIAFVLLILAVCFTAVLASAFLLRMGPA